MFASLADETPCERREHGPPGTRTRISAVKSGVLEPIELTAHANHNAIAAISSLEQPDFMMLLGPDQTAQPLEIGVVAAEDNDYAIHAMPARPKFLNMIRPNPGGQA